MFTRISKILIVFIMLTVFSIGFQANAATEEEMKAVQQATTEAFNAHDVEQFLSYLTEDVIHDYVPAPTSVTGKEENRAFMTDVFQTFPDGNSTTQRVLTSGNILVHEWIFTGTLEGEWMGMGPTGKGGPVPHLTIFEFEGDKVKRMTTYFDMVTFMVNSGLMPQPEPLELVPSFTLPEPEPTGLSPVDAVKEITKRWNTHDVSNLAKMMNPDGDFTIAALGVPMDRDAFIASQEMYFTAFPDNHAEVVRAVDMGDGWVLCENIFSGTQDGPYFGIPPSGKSYKMRSGMLYRFDEDGLLTNLHVYFDNMAVLTQIGAIPSNPTEATLGHHLQALGEGNIDVLMADYAEDAVLFTPDGALHGHDEIRPLFETMVASVLPPGSDFEMLQQIVEGEIAYIVWSAESENYNIPFGTDTFVIRDGKILNQTFAGLVLPKDAEAPPLPKTLELPESAEKDVLMKHLQAFAKGDVDAIMADYAEDAVIFTQDGTLHGHDEIRPFFETVVKHVLPPGSPFEMLQQIIEGEIAYIVWSAESANYNIPFGTDTFIIRDGKIVTQTFASQMLPLGHHKLDIIYEFVQDFASKPVEREDGLYLVSTQEAVFNAKKLTLTFDDGTVIETTGKFVGKHQELKVVFDENGNPVKGVGTSYGTCELFDEDGNTLFRGTYTAEDEVMLSPDFELIGYSSKAEALTKGQGPYSGYFCSGNIEASLELDPENPEELIIHGVGDAKIEKIPPEVGVEEDFSNVFFLSLASGLNMISLPLKSITPYTARSFAEEISATTVIKLDEAKQQFVGFTLDAPDDGFAVEGGKGYIVNVPEGRVVAFTGAAWTNQPPVESAPVQVQDDSAWAFVVSGRILQSESSAFAVTVRNTRTNAVATDVIRAGYFAPALADLNRKPVVQIGDILEVTVKNRKGEIISPTLSYTVTPESIRQAFISLTLKNIEIPQKSQLLQNYPNPFNPETWIPYQLHRSAEVVIDIFDMTGQLVRKLELGHRQAGYYLGRSRAAHWDGHNDTGEKVASGIYFYQIKADDFSDTRRMLIVK